MKLIWKHDITNHKIGENLTTEETPETIREAKEKKTPILLGEVAKMLDEGKVVSPYMIAKYRVNKKSITIWVRSNWRSKVKQIKE